DPEFGSVTCSKSFAMNAFRLFITLLAVALAGAAFGQSGERGSTPPGQSRDGAAPSAGAIKGGSILPGESGGMPDRTKMEKEKRCDELFGTLREDCLKQEREAASGETKLPSDIRRKAPARAD
ncbi:MAG TPA: hypothetical protein VGX52_08835, partial [Burkholderiales bacterium]|nr:hypothetical protein [Burkholderiales bacterium]